MRAGNFYSAQLMEASARFNRRIRVTNRGTGIEHIYSYGQAPVGVPIPVQLERRVLEIHGQIGRLSPQILWYDPKLNLLFFELIPRD